MGQNRVLKTSIYKKPAIFSAIGMVTMTFFILWFSFSDDVLYMRLIFIIFCSIFDLAAIVLFCSQVFVKLIIKDEYVHSWIFFIHKKVHASKIKEIIYYDNGYTFYLKGHVRFAAINSADPLSGEIVRYIEKFGAKYSDKESKKTNQ